METKLNRRKKPAHRAAGSLRTRMMQRVVAVVGVVALAVAGISATVMTAGATVPNYGNQTPVADESTLTNWQGAVGIEDTTENVGRIWTDKTVQTGDVTLQGDLPTDQTPVA